MANVPDRGTHPKRKAVWDTPEYYAQDAASRKAHLDWKKANPKKAQELGLSPKKSSKTRSDGPVNWEGM